MSPSHAAVANGTGNGGMTAHGQTNAYLERKDVHRGNIMVMIAGLKDLLKHKHRKVGRRKRKQVIEHEHAAQLERLFFGTDFTDEEQLACMRGTGWIPSHVYAQVEMNLHRILGNPQKTAEFIPRPAYRYNFGVPFGWKLHLIRAMLSPTASMVGPSLGFSEILPMMSPELQSNKLEDLYQIGVYHAIMRTTPVRIRGTILRHPHTDISRGFFYEGFILSQTLFFMDEVGTYRRLVVDYSIFEEVNKWRDFMLPGYHLKDDGDKLYLCLETGGTVQRQLIAQQCRLYREDTKDGVFYTQTDPSSERAIADDFVVGWKVVKDIHVTQASGETWRLLQGGTVFSAEAGCGLTRYDFEPKTARARSVFKMYHNLYTRPAIPVSLALASLGTVGGIALAAATETLNLWQFGPLAGLVAAGVVGIPMGFTALTKVGANLRTDVVRRQQDDRHRQWLREQGRDLERESDRRKSELYPDQETAAKIETGDISSLVYDNATIMGVDLEGYTGLGIWFGDQARAEILDEMVRQFGPKLGPKMAKHRGAVLGNIRLAEFMAPWKQGHYDYDADPEMARREFPVKIEPNRVMSRHLSDGGDGYYATCCNHENFGQLVAPSIRYCFVMHNHAARMTDPRTNRPMEMRGVVALAEGGVLFNYFGRTREDGRSVKVRQEAQSPGLALTSRLEEVGKKIRKGFRAATGLNANRMVVIPLALWEAMPAAERMKYRHEYLGLYDIRDHDPMHLVRVMDDGCHAMEEHWDSWEFTREARRRGHEALASA